MRSKIVVIVAALALLVPLIAHAEDAPLVSAKRLSVVLQAGVGFPKDAGAEGVIALSPSYSLGITPALVAPVRYGFGEKETALEPSFSVMLTPANAPRQVLVRAGYGFYWKDGAASDEPCVAASLVIPIKGRFAVSVPAIYRTRSSALTVDARVSLAMGGK